MTLPGASPKTVIVGSHLDSVPNGGWLDGCLGVMAALEALRMHARPPPPVTLKLVDWADEEGARFGRSLLGSSAAAGALKIDEVRELKDRQGTRLVDALAENGVALDRMLDAHARAEGDRRARLSRAAHRAGTGARVDAASRPASCSARSASSATCSGSPARRRIPDRRRFRCGATRFSPRRKPRSSAARSRLRHSKPGPAAASSAPSASSTSSRRS